MKDLLKSLLEKQKLLSIHLSSPSRNYWFVRQDYSLQKPDDSGSESDIMVQICIRYKLNSAIKSRHLMWARNKTETGQSVTLLKCFSRDGEIYGELRNISEGNRSSRDET